MYSDETSDARIGALPRTLVTTSHSSCPDQHQMSPHPSCKETNLNDLFSFGSKDTTIVKTPLINDTGSTWDSAEMQRFFFFAVKVSDLFIRGYVWEFFNLYKHNLCHGSGISFSCNIVKDFCTDPGTRPAASRDSVHPQTNRRKAAASKTKLTWLLHLPLCRNRSFMHGILMLIVLSISTEYKLKMNFSF